MTATGTCCQREAHVPARPPRPNCSSPCCHSGPAIKPEIAKLTKGEDSQGASIAVVHAPGVPAAIFAGLGTALAAKSPLSLHVLHCLWRC